MKTNVEGEFFGGEIKVCHLGLDALILVYFHKCFVWEKLGSIMLNVLANGEMNTLLLFVFLELHYRY